MPEAISFEDSMKILAQARTGLNAVAAGFRQRAPHEDAMPDVYGVQGDQPETQAQANIPNPPGWSDKFKLPDEPPKSRMNNGGIDPGFRAGAPDQGQQWSSRPGYKVTPVNLPKYGPHNPVLSEDQAHLLQLLWLVTGQNANTVGRGRVLQFAPVSNNSSSHDPRGGDYFNGGANPLGVPIPDKDRIGYEDTFGVPSPHPYGYSADGRPLQWRGETDEQSRQRLSVGISEYAPGRAMGTYKNPDKQTETNPGEPQRGFGRVKAE